MTIKKVSIIALALSALAPAAGAYDFEKDGIYYNLSQDGNRAVVTYSSLQSNSYSGDVVIPATVEYQSRELTVRQIDNLAFVACGGLKSVTLGENVVMIGTQAFSHCTGLQSVTLNEKLYSIGDYAFEYCSAMKSLDIPASTEEIGYGVFQLTSGLISINVAPENRVYMSIDGVLYTADKKSLICFPAASMITDLVIPDEVVIIDENAFLPAVNLESITIGPKAIIVEPMTFSSCIGVKNFTVADDNEDMKSVDGVLFDKNVATLLQYPLGRYVDEYTLPEGVKNLEMLSMAGVHISNLTLPSTLSRVNAYAFYNTMDVESLTVLAVTPPAVAGNDFFTAGVVEDAPLYVEPGSVAAYKKAAGWKSFHHIVGIGSDGIAGIAADGDSKVEIFDLQGRKVFDGRRSEMKVPSKGYYILKSGDESTKVVL